MNIMDIDRELLNEICLYRDAIEKLNKMIALIIPDSILDVRLSQNAHQFNSVICLRIDLMAELDKLEKQAFTQMRERSLAFALTRMKETKQSEPQPYQCS